MVGVISAGYANGRLAQRMLLHLHMKLVGVPFVTLVATTLVTVVTAAAPAQAGGYLGLSLTGGADMNSAQANTSVDTRKAIALGKRWGMISLEGNLATMDATITRAAYSGKTAGIAGRISVPVAPLFSVFGTLGLEQTWLSPDNDALPGFAGSQTVVGAGLEAKLNFMAHGTLWLGYIVRTGELATDDGNRFDAQTASFAVGATLGF